jgi:hypothetical protein
MLSLLQAGDLVSPVFMRFLAPYGLSTVILGEDLDHNALPVLRAKLHFKMRAIKPDGRNLLDAILEAEAALRAEGDERDILIQPIYADGEPAEDEIARPNRQKKSSRS